LLGGTDKVKPAKVMVLGYGIAGSNAVQMARGLGARVTVLEIDKNKIKDINELKDPYLVAKKYSLQIIKKDIADQDLVVGAVLIPGAKAPRLVTRKMVQTMKPGSVIVDISIDQGGCFETSRPTSHEHPIYRVYDVVHYCVTNMPGAVARTSTMAITSATLPYIIKIAKNNLRSLCKKDISIAKGVNTHQGFLTYRAVADAFNLQYTSLDKII